MKYRVTSIIIGNAESPRKLKADALKDIKETIESRGGEPNNVTINDIFLHRIVVKTINNTAFEIWEAIGDERLHKKKFETIEDKKAYLNQMLMKAGRYNRV